jgi:hypothetical protein
MRTRMSHWTCMHWVVVMVLLSPGCAVTGEILGWRGREPAVAATTPIAPNPQEYQASGPQAETRIVQSSTQPRGCCGGGSGCGGRCGQSSGAIVAPQATDSVSTDGDEMPAAQFAKQVARPSTETALAGTQKTCPVADEDLGSMGPPVPVTVQGQTIYVCCAGCEAAVRKNPGLYLGKVTQELGQR